MRILFLSHRIPYPPDKGDKIRSFRLLEALAQRHDVRLITHADDPRDLKHLPELLRDLPRRERLSGVAGCRASLRSVARPAPGRRALVRDVPRPPRAAREVREALADRSARRRRRLLGSTRRVPARATSASRSSSISSTSTRRSGRAYAAVARGPMRWIYRPRGPARPRVRARARRARAARISVATDREAAAVPRRGVAAPRRGDHERRRGPGAEAPSAARPRAPRLRAARWTTPRTRDAASFAARSGPARSCRRSVPHARLRIVGRNPARAVRALASPSRRRGQRARCPTSRRRSRGPKSACCRCASSGACRTRSSSRSRTAFRSWRRPRCWRRSARKPGSTRSAADDARGPRGLRRRGCSRTRALRDRIGEGGRRLARDRFRWDRFESAHARASSRRSCTRGRAHEHRRAAPHHDAADLAGDLRRRPAPAVPRPLRPRGHVLLPARTSTTRRAGSGPQLWYTIAVGIGMAHAPEGREGASAPDAPRVPRRHALLTSRRPSRTATSTSRGSGRSSSSSS